MSAEDVHREAMLDAVAVIRLYAENRVDEGVAMLNTTADFPEFAEAACSIAAGLLGRFEATDQRSIIELLIAHAVKP